MHDQLVFTFQLTAISLLLTSVLASLPFVCVISCDGANNVIIFRHFQYFIAYFKRLSRFSFIFFKNHFIITSSFIVTLTSATYSDSVALQRESHALWCCLLLMSCRFLTGD